MNKIIFITSLLVLIGCASSPESQLQKYFITTSNNNDLTLNPDEARWIAYGYMNGVVFNDHANGNRIFINVPVNKNKGIKILEDLYLAGDQQSRAYLGILYRNGDGVDEDIERSLELLKPVKKLYFDASAEYGIAIHKMLRSGLVKKNNKNSLINEMISSLEFGAQNNYIPANNALSQIYKEGIFVKKDINKSEIHLNKSKALIEKKLNILKKISESQMLIAQYSIEAKREAQKFDTMMMLVSMGTIGAMSYSSLNQSCLVGCNPPSVTDLVSWGVL